MKKIVWFFRLSNQQLSPTRLQRIAGSIGAAILLVTAGIALGQNPTTSAPLPAPEAQIAAPQGYTVHQSVDLGGRMAGASGSRAMYDTLVNMQSGPRVLGESFEMRALPGNKHTLVDTLSAIGSGFGGDPYNFAKLDFSKGKLYEFSGVFRRDRQYFDYDLLGNPNIPGGQSIPVGPAAAPTGSLPWPQVMQSTVMFNTVRRMTDTSLTLLPLSKVTYRAGYSQNIFEGPSLSPSGYQFATGDAVLQEYQRNSTDDFTGAIEWKPVRGTRVTFEEQINHYKDDSYFTLAPGSFIAQEADGTPVALNNYDSLTPLKDSCDTFAQGSNPVFTAPQTNGGLPVISPYCSAVTSYSRTQPTRVLTPTETFRLQSSSIRNISMNGNFRYTKAKMNLPDYYDSYQGLNETAVKATSTTPAGYYGVRSLSYTASASAKREVVAADYGIVWQASKTFSLADQVDYSDLHQPGTTTMTSVTTLKTPTDTAASFGSASINYASLITATGAPGASTFEGSGAVGTPMPAYFGQRFLINNLTGSWDASSRATLSFTYRYRAQVIAENLFSAATSTTPVDPGGNPGNNPLAVGATTNGTVTIHENGGILNAALRPAANWRINGTVEALYADNAFTPVGPRQTRRYRVHTIYRPKPWATVSGAWNDLERHNNTNNTGTTPIDGPLDHVDHSRIYSLGAVLMPNEHYGFDFSYAYSDVFAATNICYDNGAQNAATVVGLPGTASTNSSGAANVCPGVFTRGSTTQLADWFARDFMDAPTQYVSAAVTLSPVGKVHSSVGYRISDVSGTQFFNDARSVNGSLNSRYQSPFVNLAWTVHPGWIWKGEYNYFGYGEGGPSGPQFCSTSTTLTSAVVPCTSLPEPTGLTEPASGLTAPRTFRANNVTIGMHYEF
jgi:hypothetical protein